MWNLCDSQLECLGSGETAENKQLSKVQFPSTPIHAKFINTLASILNQTISKIYSSLSVSTHEKRVKSIFGEFAISR